MYTSNRHDVICQFSSVQLLSHVYVKYIPIKEEGGEEGKKEREIELAIC